MEIIGDSWKLGEIGIEDEHYYTGIIESAIQRMQAFIKQKPANGFKAICGCPGNEQHNIGIRCLASQLNSEGWKSYYIGSSLPLESVLSAINTHKPNLVCLSISELSEAQITNCELIHVSALNQKAKLMVGGRAFRSSYQVSADFVSDSISTGIKYAEQIINQDK
jgi:methanogenic corrinoid protein MtbC1